MDKRRKVFVVCIYVIGSVLIACGLLVLLWWYFRYIDFVSKKLPLIGPDSLRFPVSQISVYMFNWTNANATITGEDRVIKLEEIGPYVYRLDTFRENFTWNPNSTLTYSMRRQFHLVPEESKGDPHKDVIISPNIPLISFSYQLQNWPGNSWWYNYYYLDTGINKIVKTNLYVQKSVHKLLFKGYADEYLSWLKKHPNASENWDKKIPDRFAGFMHQKNNTDTFNIYTGEANLEMMGLVHTRNYRTNSPVFEGSCAKVGGSLVDFWPIDTARNQEASLFMPDFCSTVQLSNKGRINVHNIPGIRFIGDGKTFDNGSIYSENKCYCSKKECNRDSGIRAENKSKSGCDWDSGARNVSSCLGAPVFLSFPHFLAADPSYRKQIEGLKPDKHKHVTYLTFHEHYGVLLEGASRMQLNVHLRRVDVLQNMRNLSNVILPVLWFEEKLDLQPSVRDHYYFLFLSMEWILSIIGFVLLILGLIIVVIGCIMSDRKSEKSEYEYSRGYPIESVIY